MRRVRARRDDDQIDAVLGISLERDAMYDEEGSWG
jgi:hypothetical protein